MNIGNRAFLQDNYYLTLGVNFSATDEEIERAFRKLAPYFHPDKREGNSEDFCRLEEARRILLNPVYRRHYDETRDITQDFHHIRTNLNNNYKSFNSLPSCHKISSDILQDISKWENKFPNLILQDNVSDSLKLVFEGFLKNESLRLDENNEQSFYCDLCDKEFVSEEDHYDKILLPYVQEMLEDFGKPVTAFKFLRNKLRMDLNIDEEVSSTNFASTESLITHQIKNAADLLDEGAKSEAHVLYASILKQLEFQNNSDFIIMDSLFKIVKQIFKDDLYSIAEGFKSILGTFNENFSEFVEIHRFFLKKFIKENTLESFKYALAAFHFADFTEPEFDTENEEFIKWSKTILSNELDTSVNRADFEIMSQILNFVTLETVSVLEEFIARKSAQYNLDQVSGDYKAAIFLIRGTISKFQTADSTETLNFLQKALYTCSESPFKSRDGIALAVMTQTLDLTLHKRIVRQLWLEIEKLLDTAVLLEEMQILTPTLKVDELFTATLWFNQVTPCQVLIAKRNEQAIDQRFKTPLKKALAYFDLSMGVGIIGKVNCFLIGISHLLDAMTLSDDLGSVFAYGKVIKKYCKISLYLLRRYYGPNVHGYTQRFTISALLQSIVILRYKLANCDTHMNHLKSEGKKDTFILSNSGIALISKALFDTVQFVKIYPLVSIPSKSVTDSILGYQPEISFLTNYIHSKVKSSEHSKYFPKDLYSYQELDSVWRGWGNSEVSGPFDECRLRCMQDVLERKGWDFSDVEDIMSWHLIRRTPCGWMNNEEFELNFDDQPVGEIFTSFEGIRILENGEVILLLDEGQPDSLKLFTLEDVYEIFEKNISTAFITLEDPEPFLNCHPFQEFSYWPANLEGTEYLLTMLHADYFLKQITTGIETCSLFPFEMRSTADGFLQRLSPELQLGLRPILERIRDPIDPSSENAHRFWIEMKTVDTNIDNSNGTFTLNFCKVEAVVRTKRQRRTTSGTLEDDEMDAEIIDTAEIQLANFLTKNYDIIGAYFPFLLRLKELAKISKCQSILSAQLIRYKSHLKAIENHTFGPGTVIDEDEKEYLDDVKNTTQKILDNYRDCGWDPPHPIYSLWRLEQNYQETLKLNNLVGKEHSLAPGERDRVRNNITANLQKADEFRFDNCASQIAGLFKVEPSKIRHLIRGWFDRNLSSTNALEEICSSGKLASELPQLKRKINEIEILGINSVETSNIISLSNNGECCWVPATFCDQFKPPIETKEDQIEEQENHKRTNNLAKDTSGASSFKKWTTKLKDKLSKLITSKQKMNEVNSDITSVDLYKNSISDLSCPNLTKPNETKPFAKQNDPSTTTSNGECKFSQTNSAVKKKPRSGIKPPRIYGGVSTQLPVNIVKNKPTTPAKPVSISAKKQSRSGGGGKGNSKKKQNNKTKKGDNDSKSKNQSKKSKKAEAKATYERKDLRHFPRCKSRKEAKERAFHSGGKNKPDHDTAHKLGQPSHFHSVDKDGERIENGVHYVYGPGNIRAGRIKMRNLRLNIP